MSDNIQLYNDLIHKCFNQVNQLLDFAKNGHHSQKLKQSTKLLKKINVVAHRLKRINNHFSWHFGSTKKSKRD